MAFGTFSLTGKFLLYGGAPAIGRVQIDGIPQNVINVAGKDERVGPRTVLLDSQGAFSIDLPSDSTTGNSTGIAYRVTVNLKHQNLTPVEFYAGPIGTTVDLSAITPAGGPIALTPLAVSQADFAAFQATTLPATIDARIAASGGGGQAASRADTYGGPYVAAMGDSITALNGSTTGYQQADTHQNWLYAHAGGRLRWAPTAAQAGYTLAQIRDTQLPLILAQNPLPDAVLLLGGTNDVGSSTFNLAASMTVWTDIYTQLRNKGIRLIACTIPPRGDSTTANQKADKFNAALRNKAALLGLDLVDYHKILVDPATGGYKSGLCLSDSLHPSFLGCREMGRYAAAVLSPRFSDVRPYLVEHAVDATDLLTGSGLFRTDTNADGIADGWSSFSAAAYSITADPDGTKWQRITRDSSSSGALLQKSVSTAVAPGDVFELSARVQASGWDAVVTPTSTLSWTFSCQFTGASGATSSASPAYALHCDIVDGVLTQRVTVPTGATGQIKVNLQIQGNPAAGSVWVQFANVTARNLTAIGAI